MRDLISGSCQFPTLRFVVDRYRRLQYFVPEDFWKIDVVIAKDDIRAQFIWSRERLYDRHCCVVLYEKCLENPAARVLRVDVKPKDKWYVKCWCNHKLYADTWNATKIGSLYHWIQSNCKKWEQACSECLVTTSCVYAAEPIHDVKLPSSINTKL